MIVARISTGVVQVTVDQIIGVAAVRDGLMATICTVLVRGIAAAAAVAVGAGVGVGGPDFDDMRRSNGNSRMPRDQKVG